MKRYYLLLIVFTLLVSCTNKNSEIILPSLFSDHMVLQQNTNAPIWGWATPGVSVKLSTSWDIVMKTTTDKDGKWLVEIPTPKYGGPYQISISAGDSIKTIKDVLIGEVWLASGQSNMEMPVKGWGAEMPIDSSAQEIASSDNYQIRMFTVQRKKSYNSEKDCIGEWKDSNPKNTGDFSATAYFFAKNLYKNLKVPIGIIHSSWGGTPAEAWTSKEFVSKVKGFEDADKKLVDSKINQEKITVWLNNLKKIDFDEALKNSFKDEKNDKEYSSGNFNDSDWKEMTLPAYWETKQLQNFNGLVWFRKDFNIPKGTSLKNLKLYLGKIDDMDETYINGKKIGSQLKTGFWDTERLYPIDDQILQEGKNTISVKVIDNYGGGGIYGDKDIAIINNKNKTLVNLSGKWKYKPVGVITDGNIYFFNKKNPFSELPKSTYSLSEHSPSILYNAMIAPLVPYTIKGAIWYQGESNVGRAKQYETLFPTMIKSWRKVWDIGDFPFYYVQIAPYNYSKTDTTNAAELRFAQFLSLKENNVGMVVTTDIGDVNYIHPSNKLDVGKRLALWALNKTYGNNTIVYSGPLFKDVEFKKNKAIISFTNISSGLICKGNELNYFEIAGNDLKFYKANAKIENDKVIVWSAQVKKPLYVRFGWKNNAEPNFFNKSGLPGSPFQNQ